MTRVQRGARLLHEYVGPGAIHVTAWHEVRQPSGLYDIPASVFLRGFAPRRQHLEPLRLRRIARAMTNPPRLPSRLRTVPTFWGYLSARLREGIR